MADFWKDGNDLGRKLSISLQKIFKTKPRIGWIRADKAASQEILQEMSQLSKENRHLRLELEKYTMSMDRKPDIKIDIDKDLIIRFSDEIATEGVLEKKTQIDYETLDPRVRSVISKEEIDLYNKSLPSNAAIKNYNNKLKKYNLVRSNIQEFNFIVDNNGNLQANNIYISLVFPKELLLFENYEQVKELKPEKILFPENPIKKIGQSILQTYQNPVKSISSSIFNNELFSFTQTSLHLPSFNQNHWVNIESDHKLRIYKNKLLHTMNTVFDSEDGFYIAPLKKGEFQIQYSIVCEEYLEPDSGTFILNVE
jgi:hypothetical protein